MWLRILQKLSRDEEYKSTEKIMIYEVEVVLFVFRKKCLSVSGNSA